MTQKVLRVTRSRGIQVAPLAGVRVKQHPDEVVGRLDVSQGMVTITTLLQVCFFTIFLVKMNN